MFVHFFSAREKARTHRGHAPSLSPLAPSSLRMRNRALRTSHINTTSPFPLHEPTRQVMSLNKMEHSSSHIGSAIPLLKGEEDYAQWAPQFYLWCQQRELHSALLAPTADFEETKKTVLEFDVAIKDAQRIAGIADMRKQLSLSYAAAAGASASPVKKQESASSSLPLPKILQENDLTKALRASLSTTSRTYAYLLQALPADLKAQAVTALDHVEDHAYPTWVWLKQKFQSNEDDIVDGLLDEWNALHQNDVEPFDLYRSRVLQLRERLAAGGEPRSDREFARTLLFKLRDSTATSSPPSRLTRCSSRTPPLHGPMSSVSSVKPSAHTTTAPLVPRDSPPPPRRSRSTPRPRLRSRRASTVARQTTTSPNAGPSPIITRAGRTPTGTTVPLRR